MLFRNAPLVWFFAAVTLLAALPPAMADVVITIHALEVARIDGRTRLRHPQ